MPQIERRSESRIVQHEPEWVWDGDYRYSVVAQRLKEVKIMPYPFGNGGITFTLDGSGPYGSAQSANASYNNKITFIIESAVYETSSVVGISNSKGNHRLSHFMGERYAFSVDILVKKNGYCESIDMPEFGPAYSDPTRFASVFFFIMKDRMSSRLLPLLGPLHPLLDLRTTDSLEGPDSS